MPEKITEPKLPHSFSRLAFRFPIWLYHAHLGWLLVKHRVGWICQPTITISW